MNHCYSGMSTVGSDATYSHAEGEYVRVWGDRAHGEGTRNILYGTASHIEGSNNIIGSYSQSPDVREKYSATLDPDHNNMAPLYCHAEGYENNVTGTAAHVEGNSCTVHGNYAHGEGYYTKSWGTGTHTEGGYTKANGDFSHAEGYNNTAGHDYSHVEGRENLTAAAYQHVQGKYNVADSTMQMIVGYGSEESNVVTRKNIFTIDTSGNIQCGQSDTTGDFTGHYGTVNGVDLTQLAADVAAIKAHLGI